ncbi:MAG: YbbR-like protein [Bacteroidetes bacterium ADurb.Bin408]|nr:MAG: YbbR-like protein [Bacteroidetes bacterium ADurb.Bin408]
MEIDYAYSKKVPLAARFSYSVEKQHFVYNTIKVEPDSVWVYGSKSKVMGISQLETDSADFPNLTGNVEEFIKIKNPAPLGIHLSHNFAKVIIPIEKFTEMELNVPVKFTDNYTKTHVKIFPENVKLTLMVALKDYKNITPDMFRVIADTTGFNKSNYLTLRVESAPAFVKVNRLTPESVEYIRIR